MVDPQQQAQAIEALKEAEGLWRRDFMLGAVFTLLAAIAIFTYAIRNLMRSSSARISAVEDARVEDQKEAREKYDSLSSRMAQSLERGAETSIVNTAKGEEVLKAVKEMRADLQGVRDIVLKLKPPKGGSG